MNRARPWQLAVSAIPRVFLLAQVLFVLFPSVERRGPGGKVSRNASIDSRHVLACSGKTMTSTLAPSGKGELGTTTPLVTMPVVVMDMTYTSVASLIITGRSRRWQADSR